ncbi:hypothetical protein [Cupriavidus basilensis]|nr:hypothetical protein [Cupriavidus basilensis]
MGGAWQRMGRCCQIENTLTTRVGDVWRKRSKAGDGTVASTGDANGAQVLRLQITHILGVGGGAWTSYKAITVTADLHEGIKVICNTEINR